MLHSFTYASQFALRVYQKRQFPTKEMIAIFSLWTFHLYVTTFQHQLHVKFIRYYRVCGSYHDVLDSGCPRTRTQQNEGCLVVKLKSFLRTSYGRHHDLVRRWPVGIDHGHVPSVVISIRSLSHSWLIIGLAWRVTWQHLCNRNCLSFRKTQLQPHFYSIFSFLCSVL